MANMLTEKEAQIVSDLLKTEGLYCRKCALYSRVITDSALSELFKALYKSHSEKYNILLNSLGGKNEL